MHQVRIPTEEETRQVITAVFDDGFERGWKAGQQAARRQALFLGALGICGLFLAALAPLLGRW